MGYVNKILGKRENDLQTVRFSVTGFLEEDSSD